MTRLRSFFRPMATRACRAERGQVAVIFAGGLVTMLLLTGLVIDGGIAFLNRREAQNIADLAAMAGTKTVSDHYVDGGRTGADVYAAVEANAASNGCTAAEACTWEARYVRPTGPGSEQEIGQVHPNGAIPGGAQGVVVTVTRTPGTFFVRVIGQSTWQVETRATALTAHLDGLPPGGVLPIAVDPPNANFQPGDEYQLTAGMDGPGNFSWLSWDGSNDANSLADSICNPDNPALSFTPAPWVAGDPGKTNSGGDAGVRACVDSWIDEGATVLIPTWSEARGQGNNFEFKITGLVAMVVTGRGQPAIDSITARFVEYYPLPSIEAGYGGPPIPGQGVFFLGLVR